MRRQGLPRAGAGPCPARPGRRGLTRALQGLFDSVWFGGIARKHGHGGLCDAPAMMSVHLSHRRDADTTRARARARCPHKCPHDSRDSHDDVCTMSSMCILPGRLARREQGDRTCQAGRTAEPHVRTRGTLKTYAATRSCLNRSASPWSSSQSPRVR